MIVIIKRVVFMQSLTKQLPMIATYGRMVLAIPLIILIKLGSPWSIWPAAILFILASLTDWLDGYWARKYNCESAMGKFMDPIADKILVLAALIMLLELGLLPSILVILLISRDIYIGGLRSVAAANQVIIAAKPFGKWKTGFQMIGIPCLLLSPEVDLKPLPLESLGLYALWFSLALSLISGVQYTWAYYANRKD